MLDRSNLYERQKVGLYVISKHFFFRFWLKWITETFHISAYSVHGGTVAVFVALLHSSDCYVVLCNRTWNMREAFMAEGDREVFHFKLLETNTNIYKYAN
jgi:hypothetical protein